jgi:peptidoglycan/LPS O-acetylase OafA/YrhL
MLLRKFSYKGGFYRMVVAPLARASYGAYLIHMFVLLAVFAELRQHCSTPVTILATAFVTFVASSLISLVLGRIPGVGRWLVG